MTAPLLHHRVDGSGPPLILGPSLGASLAVWDPQVPSLARRHRLIRYDLPGHGGSAAGLLPHDGSATVADLAEAVIALADSLGLGAFSYAGVSLGGAVGLHLAVHCPERVRSLALVCSSAVFDDAAAWSARAALVRADGPGAMAASRPGVWYSAAFADSSPLAAALIADLRAVDPAGYAACCDALGAYDLRDQLSRVEAPTLVVAGRDDPATGPEHAREIADAVPGATLLEIPGAAHLAGVERPEPVSAALAAHFRPSSPADDVSRHAAGTAARRAVLGDAYVDAAVARTTEFTARFQDFITRCAWGEIWTDDTLDRRTRSCVTLTALTALGHRDELALHVRAALGCGLSRREIGEVLLQCAVYCGAPAANAAFATAQRVFDEIDAAR
ncbi:alpha/beta fold hydrolase [Streptomyces sp. NPDC051907]|uniref:bifunctional 3-oxoadipate enol-lactonase/4-carboxymuconolactone decarboxylase PcaDC n=1 Tax=Streptomyces sp. NPDC051907 TaxID=3155284 RepID=UPI003434C067